MYKDYPSIYDHPKNTIRECLLPAEVSALTEELGALDFEIDPSAEPQRDKYWHRLTDAFRRSRDVLREFELGIVDDPQLIVRAQKEFRLKTAPWFDRSWIAYRARTKPNGFVGDFEMLLTLYDRVSNVKGIGGYIDLCIADLRLAHAVQTRMETTREFLRDEVARRHGDVRILNVASGPCREYVGWPYRANNGSIHVTCIDVDTRSLEYVERSVVPTATGIDEFRLERYNAIRTRSAEATKRKLGKFDIIYSIGLCDYLSDELLLGLLEGWHNTLNNGGVLFVAFKDAVRYDKIPYQWHLDWHFLQRTQGDCLRLFQDAGFDVNSMEMTRDSSGIIMNFISRVKPRTTKRFDKPAQTGRPAMTRGVDQEAEAGESATDNVPKRSSPK